MARAAPPAPSAESQGFLGLHVGTLITEQMVRVA